MDSPLIPAVLVPRQENGSASVCEAEPQDLSNMGLRIASIFIIMAGSMIGALAPVLLTRATRMHVPKMTFFVFKYVGTGVIISTAWMHLLSPAVESLHDPCLQARLGDYDWAFAIGLMTIMFMFLVELLAARFGEKVLRSRERDVEKSGDKKSGSGGSGGSSSGGGGPPPPAEKDMHEAGFEFSVIAAATASSNNTAKTKSLAEPCAHAADIEARPGCFGPGPDGTQIPGLPDDVSYPPGGQDHLAHRREHDDEAPASLAGQLTAIFILEFGVVFHSVFIGLALATSNTLVILLVVLVFHQTLEGLGLGSRLAAAPWPQGRRWIPYLLGAVYGLSTPIAIAAGLGARPSTVATSLLVQGIFDAISAGILLYTGLVELLAHEFMFNPHMRNAPLRVQMFAYGCVALGALVMAVLAKWA